MKKGSETGVRFCIRAMIDYANPNGALRDPVLYRCKPEPHVRCVRLCGCD
jgi:glutamyl/glutaminyl-tRNA synthetase